MTKEQWAEIETKLQSPWGNVSLMCDGYKLTLQIQRDKMRLVIMIFIDGEFKGIWFNECEERRRFFRPSVRKIFPPSAFKGFTKKEMKSDWVKKQMDKTITAYSPLWPSFRPLKAHLIKNNTSIELAPEA
jgi:hypothetical protein